MSAAEFRVRVFGATVVRDADGEPLHLTASMRRMLSFIVAAGPHGVSADRALNELADGDGSAKAGSRLRMDVSRLRKRIGSDVLPSSSGQWRLDIDPSDVDYFALLASADKPLPNRPSELLALLAGDAFFDANPSPLVEDAIQRTLAMRQSLLQRACDERPDLVDPQILLAARNWVERNPLNEDLITFVTQCHLVVGETTAARELLGRSLAAFTEMLGETAPAFVKQFEPALGPIRPAISGLGEPEPTRHSFLDTDHSSRVVGRDSEEATLTQWLEDPEASPLMLHGPSGVGKTTLLRSTANEATAQGQVVVAASGREFESVPYAAFRRAIGEELHNHLDGEEQPAQSDTWALTLAILQSRASDVVLMLDDAQWLDSLSQALLQFLLRSEAPGLRVLISGREAATATNSWETLRRTAASAGAQEMSLSGLGLPGIELLIRDLRPDASLASQKRLALHVLELSDGLPGIARPLVSGVDRAMLNVPTSSHAKSLTWLVSDLSPLAKSVGQAAAVLAQPLTYPTIATITGLSDTELLQAFEELANRGVLRADRVPGFLSFAHALIRDAFLLEAPPTKVDDLHRRAAEVVSDIHQRALHQRQSMRHGEEVSVASALVVSGDAHYENGSLEEAVRSYAAADDLDAISLPPQSLTNWAAAADRLRLDGSTIRQRAFDAAMNEGQLDLALQAACSGLPEAEDASGDTERIRLLDEIDSDLLSGHARFQHSATLGRQLVFAGDAARATQWVDVALACAKNDDDLDEAVRTKWLASFSTTSPQQRRGQAEFYPTFAGEVPNSVRMLQAVDALAAGELTEADLLNKLVAARIVPAAKPIDFWHHTMFRSTVESARGNERTAQTFSDDALQFGMAYGIREATSAWLAQKFIRTWMVDGPANFLAQLGDMGNVEVEDSYIAQASVALALFRAGLVDDATPLAEDLTNKSLPHQSFGGIAVLAVCARVIGPESDNARAVRSALEPLSGSLLVIGGGFACLGPVDLALASVTSGDERKAFFNAARALCERPGLEGWAAATKRESAAIVETI